MLEKIRSTVAETLNCPVDQVADDTPLKDLGADSLDLYEMSMNLEEEFGVEFEDEELMQMTTISAVVECLKNHGIEV